MSHRASTWIYGAGGAGFTRNWISRAPERQNGGVAALQDPPGWRTSPRPRPRPIGRLARGNLAAAGLLVLAGCTTAGSTWMAQPLAADDWEGGLLEEGTGTERPSRQQPRSAKTRVIGAESSRGRSRDEAHADPPNQSAAGRSLGTFRNTYYDFPNEAEFSGPKVALRGRRCETIEEVPRGFFETLCVQGSGTLRSGPTVSFARRDCACAEVCPRTSQKICFDVLDAKTFPWGRGATGKPITPLLSVAVDSKVIPLGTPLYIPELAGLPRDLSHGGEHDGCFIAQDRGIRVVGKHVDVFTGHSAVTTLWNRLVPSNRGVTVVLDHPSCRR